MERIYLETEFPCENERFELLRVSKDESMKKLILFAFAMTVWIIPRENLHAQFTCTGSACNLLPTGLTNSYNTTYYNIQKNYLNEVMKTNTEAGFLANIGTSNVGTGTVRRIQFGANLSAAGYKKEDITIQEPNLKLPKLPNVGGSAIPNITLDLNPGWILGFDEHHWSRRFGIFLHGMNGVVPQKTLDTLADSKSYDSRIAIKSYGGMLRFQAIEKIGFLKNMFTWNGINVGIGHHRMEENFSLVYKEGSASTFQTNLITAKWGGDTNFAYKTNIRTTHADIRTGIGIFWFLNVIVGGGYSWNTGESSISLARVGVFSIQPSSDINIPRQYQNILDTTLLSTSTNGVLGLTVSGNSSTRRSIGYGIVGLEADVYLLKIIVEGLYGGPDLYSANVGAKISF